MYFASGSKCGLSTTSAELAGGKLVLFIAIHSSSLALEKDGLSLTGGAKEKERREGSHQREVGDIRRRAAASYASAYNTQ